MDREKNSDRYLNIEKPRETNSVDTTQQKHRNKK